MALGGAVFVRVGDHFCYAQGVGVEGCLGDEAVGERDSEEAGYACCEAQEKDVPVETGGFAEWEFGALGYKGGDCVVSVTVDGLRCEQKGRYWKNAPL